MKYIKYYPIIAIDQYGTAEDIGRADCIGRAIQILKDCRMKIKWSGYQEFTGTSFEITVFKRGIK